MLTRCPTCGTTFRVTPEQLKARQGRVRCGACQSVFNALDTLVETPIPPVPPAPAAAVAAPEPATGEPGTGPEEAAAPTEAEAPPAPPESEAEAEAPPESKAEAEPPALPEDEVEPMAAQAPALGAERIEPILAPIDEPLPPPLADTPESDATAFVPDLEPLPAEDAQLRWPWALGFVAALAILLVQATVHFRTEIAVLHPDAKPLLLTLCASLGCDIALPHRPDLASIEASDLTPNGDGKLLLAATLKNREPFSQEYPHLELTLTDTADRPLVRRVIAPADYLPPQSAAATGFGANAELAVNLVVDAPGISAAGYRLYLFYP